MKLKSAYILLLLIGLSINALSQNSILLKDINQGINGSFPNGYIQFNGKVFFSANDPSMFTELFVSDGTEKGTYMLKDINLNGSSNPNNFVVYNNRLFFSANNGSNGTELWTTDGTSAGTVMLKDINPGIGSSFPTSITVFKNELYFAAQTPSTGVELWKSDGSDAGTMVVKDINFGTTSSNPTLFTKGNNYLFFRASTPAEGQELWRSDGTTAGTILLKDINPGIAGAVINGMFMYDDTLYFNASDPINGNELWRTDGTTTNTYLVKDINPGTASSTPANFVRFKNRLFFSANTNSTGIELFFSDGSLVGTKLFAEINPNILGGNPTNLFVYNNYLFFSANNASSGFELYRTDTVSSSLQLFREINTGAASSNPAGFVIFNNDLYFTATNPTSSDVYKFSPLMDSLYMIMPYPFVNPILNHTVSNLRVCGNSIFFNGNYDGLGTEPYIISDLPRMFIIASGSNNFSSFVDSFSQADSFVLKGYNLNGNITLNTSTNFFISTNKNSGFDSTLTLLKNAMNRVDTVVYIKFYASIKGGKSGSLRGVSSNCDTMLVSLFGYGFSIPKIQINQTFSDTFISYIDSFSMAKKIWIKGNLLNGNISVKGTSIFKVSLDGLVFKDSVSLFMTGDSVAGQDVFIAFKPKIKGPVKDYITIYSPGSVNNEVQLYGIGVVKPYLLLQSNVSDTFIANLNEWSQVQSCQIIGEGLTKTVLLDCSSHFYLSNDSVDYTKPIELLTLGGSINQKLFIRFKSSNAGIFPGTIIIKESNTDTIKLDVMGKAIKKPVSSLNQMGNMIQIVQNPFIDQLTIKFVNPLEYTRVIVTDINGRQMLNEEVYHVSKLEHETSEWPVGVYFLNAFLQDNKISLKLIKSH